MHTGLVDAASLKMNRRYSLGNENFVTLDADSFEEHFQNV